MHLKYGIQKRFLMEFEEYSGRKQDSTAYKEESLIPIESETVCPLP